MRLSADMFSPFYVMREVERRGASVNDLTLTIDGIKCEDVVEASEEEGWAHIILQDENGQVCESPNHEGLLIQEVRGVVQFHWRKEHAA
jgi:hypothetical protein